MTRWCPWRYSWYQALGNLLRAPHQRQSRRFFCQRWTSSDLTSGLCTFISLSLARTQLTYRASSGFSSSLRDHDLTPIDSLLKWSRTPDGRAPHGESFHLVTMRGWVVVYSILLPFAPPEIFRRSVIVGPQAFSITLPDTCPGW